MSPQLNGGRCWKERERGGEVEDVERDGEGGREREREGERERQRQTERQTETDKIERESVCVIEVAGDDESR